MRGTPRRDGAGGARRDATDDVSPEVAHPVTLRIRTDPTPPPSPPHHPAPLPACLSGPPAGEFTMEYKTQAFVSGEVKKELIKKYEASRKAEMAARK